MTQRNALLISAVLAAFLLAVLGGLAATLLQPTAPPPAADDPTVAGAVAAAPALDPAREAAYQQALADAQAQLLEANRRLAEANAQLEAAPIPPPTTAPPAPVPTDPPAAPTYAVSAERAGQLARAVVPGATLRGPPDLVSYQDVPAYEVLLDQGTIYIDATTGRVLYNNALASRIQAAPQPARDHESEEHEHGGDD